MDYFIVFSKMFFTGVFYAAPVLLSLAVLIAFVGLTIGRREGWSRIDSLYFAFITASSVGYGDLRPSGIYGKFAAVALALIGFVMTGIIVAIGVKAASLAFADLYKALFE